MTQDASATTAPEQKKPFNPILAFVLGIVLATAVFCLMPKTEEFRAYVNDFLDTTPVKHSHAGFWG